MARYGGIKTILRHLDAANKRSKRKAEIDYFYATSNPAAEKITHEMVDLFYDANNKFLTFKIIRKTVKPKITRYVTQNYVKTPIYGAFSVKTAVVKKFNKAINPLKFVSEDVLTLKIDKNFILKLIDVIGIVPKWREKEIRLEQIANQIKINEHKIRHYEVEKNQYQYKKTDYQEVAGNFWLRLFIGFFTGFLSFIGYISKKQALLNQQLNLDNKNWNLNHKKEIDAKNDKLKQAIISNNQIIKSKIEVLTNEYNKIKNEKIMPIAEDENNWINLRDASNFNYHELKAKKGVYIIWNKTKNIYYVGQSKNMQKRLSDHFKNGTVNNIIFAKDWYSDDQFFYKYQFCQTKDELDALEKKYIEEYNSFGNGYNKTSGNT